MQKNKSKMASRSRYPEESKMEVDGNKIIGWIFAGLIGVTAILFLIWLIKILIQAIF